MSNFKKPSMAKLRKEIKKASQSKPSANNLKNNLKKGFQDSITQLNRSGDAIWRQGKGGQ